MPKAQNPFDVDDEENKGKEPVEEKVAPEVPEGTEIPVDKDEDEDDPTDDAPTRAEKRAERGRALARDLREAKEREASLESARQAAEYRAQQHETYARQMASWAAQQQQQQQPQGDPLDAHEKAARKEIEDLMELSTALQEKGALTPEKAKDLKDRYFAASQRMNEVAAARVQRWNSWQAQQSQQGQPSVQAQAEYAALQMRLRSEFPDVVDHPQAWAYANAEWAKLMAVKKGADPRDWKNVQEAMATTRRAFKMGHAPSPSEATKRRYAGVGSGGGAPQTNGKRTVPMGREFKMMAHAKYPKLAPADAERKWAQTVGKSLVEEEDS